MKFLSMNEFSLMVIKKTNEYHKFRLMKDKIISLRVKEKAEYEVAKRVNLLSISKLLIMFRKNFNKYHQIQNKKKTS